MLLWRIAMRKLLVLLGALLTCTIAGCGEDTNDTIIAGTISILDGTTSQIDQITKTLNDAVDQAKDGKPLDIAKIATATQNAVELKKKAEALQRYKAEIDVRKDSLTADQREEYARKHKAAFQQKLQSLDTAQKNLEAALRKADAVAAPNSESKANLEKLRDALIDAQKEFEVLTKRQS
jgi:DNA repair exonuclease SbcCD ATPase subunit